MPVADTRYLNGPGNKMFAAEKFLEEFDDDGSMSSISNYQSESEDDVPNSDINCEGTIRALAATIPGRVTKRDIAFQEALLAAMKYSYQESHKMHKSTEIFKVSPHYLQPASNMREISPGCKFYLSEDTVSYINVTAENAAKNGETEKWRIVVREVLHQIYGNTLANYSATGKRGNRPSIHPMLFKGLFEWANRAASGTLTKKQFIMHINKTASNKRKYQNRKAGTKNSSSTSKRPKKAEKVSESIVKKESL